MLVTQGSTQIDWSAYIYDSYVIEISSTGRQEWRLGMSEADFSFLIEMITHHSIPIRKQIDELCASSRGRLGVAKGG